MHAVAGSDANTAIIPPDEKRQPPRPPLAAASGREPSLSAFTPAQIAYLPSQSLGRLATPPRTRGDGRTAVPARPLHEAGHLAAATSSGSSSRRRAGILPARPPPRRIIRHGATGAQ